MKSSRVFQFRKFYMLFVLHILVTAIFASMDTAEIGHANVAKHIMFSFFGRAKTWPSLVLPVIVPLKILGLYPSSIIGLPFSKFLNASIFINLINYTAFLFPSRAYWSSTNSDQIQISFSDLQFSIDFQSKSIELFSLEIMRKIQQSIQVNNSASYH